MTFDPRVQTAAQEAVQEIARAVQSFIGIDEFIPGCEVIDMDPYSAGTLPRRIQVSLGGRYYQDVMYRGVPALSVGDICVVVHTARGDQYEILAAGGASGVSTSFDGTDNYLARFSASGRQIEDSGILDDTGGNVITVGADGNYTFDVEGNTYVNQDLRTSATPTFDGIKLWDTDASHTLELVYNEDDSADRVINLSVDGADRALTLQGDLTVESASFINQDVTTDGTPTFGGLTVNGAALIDGSADTEQLIIQAHSTQNDDIVQIQNSSGTVLGAVQGYGAFYSNKGESTSNLFLGYLAGEDNTVTGTGSEGLYNTFVGRSSGENNTTGNRNNAMGTFSLYSNTTGIRNNAMGYYSLFANTTGNQNNAMGYYSLFANTTGYQNNAMGYYSLFANTTGYRNNAMGTFSLFNLKPTSGAITAFADAGGGQVTVTSAGHGQSNGTTVQISGTTNYDGSYSISNVTTDTFEITDTFVEDDATGWWGIDSEGRYATAVGVYSGYNITTGSNNTLLGYNTGRGITTGDSNTILGAQVTGLAADLSNNVIIADGDGNIRLQVDEDGNAIFNGTAPLAQLHVDQSDNSAAEPVLLLDQADVSEEAVRIDYGGTATVFIGRYHMNWGSTYGDGGYGIRDNSGSMEYKNSGGSWTAMGTTPGGGATPGGSDGQIQYNNSGSFGGCAQFYYDDANDRVGVGDSTPDHTFDVDGNIGLSASGYINWGDTDGSSGYGIRDNGGDIEYKNSGGSWDTFGGSPGGNDGYVQYNNSGSFGGESNLFWDDTNNRLGIADSTPSYALDVTGSGRFTTSLGVNTTAPTSDSWALEVHANSDSIPSYVAYFYNSYGGGANGIRIRAGENSNPDEHYVYMLDGSNVAVGYITGDGSGGVNYNSASDRRIKDVIGNIDGEQVLDSMQRIVPFHYRGIHTLHERQQVGFAAQDFVEWEGVSHQDVETGMWMMDYGRVTPLLWAAVREQEKVIKGLQDRIQELEEALHGY